MRGFVKAFLSPGFDLRTLGKMKIAASGPAVVAALMGTGLPRAHRTLRSRRLPLSRPERLALFSEELAWETTKWAEIVRPKLFCAKPALRGSHWIQEARSNLPDFILFRHPLEVDGLVNVLGLEAAAGLAGKSALIAADEARASAAHRRKLNCSHVNAEAFRGI